MSYEGWDQLKPSHNIKVSSGCDHLLHCCVRFVQVWENSQGIHCIFYSCLCSSYWKRWEKGHHFADDLVRTEPHHRRKWRKRGGKKRALVQKNMPPAVRAPDLPRVTLAELSFHLFLWKNSTNRLHEMANSSWEREGERGGLGDELGDAARQNELYCLSR